MKSHLLPLVGEQLLVQAGLEGASLIIEPLGSMHAIAISPEANIYPASMIKVPLAVAVADALSQRRISSAWITIKACHATQDDIPAPFKPGYQAEIWELISAMISTSNNTATNALLDWVGREEATQSLKTYGLRHTRVQRYLSGAFPRLTDPHAHGENEHPASDAALLFRLIAQGRLPYAQRLYAALQAQIWNTKLSVGLDPGDSFAHKTGETSEYCHDGGILQTHNGQCYIIVLYTSQPANEETNGRFAHFMRLLRREHYLD